MILLIFISVTGLVLSALLHFCSLFHIYEPPRELTTLIWIGAMVVIYPAIVIAEKTRREVNAKDYKKAVLGVCPGWFLTMNGLIIMYVVGYLIFLIFKKYVGSSAVDSGQGIVTNVTHGFAGHWMGIYSLAFTMLYSCKRLKETHFNLDGQKTNEKEKSRFYMKAPKIGYGSTIILISGVVTLLVHFIVIPHIKSSKRFQHHSMMLQLRTCIKGDLQEHYKKIGSYPENLQLIRDPILNSMFGSHVPEKHKDGHLLNEFEYSTDGNSYTMILKVRRTRKTHTYIDKGHKGEPVHSEYSHTVERIR